MLTDHTLDIHATATMTSPHACATLQCYASVLTAPARLPQIKDIDWVFIFRSQLWATAVITLIPVAMLAVIHCKLPFVCDS